MPLYETLLWRVFDGNDGTNGGAGGGVPAGQTAGASLTGTGVAPTAPPPAGPPAEPPAPPPAPQIDPAAHAQQQVQIARLQARVTYPQADAALIDTLVDPAAIDAVAKRTHELALAAQSAAGQGGAPVPADNAARAAEGEQQRRIRELQFKVRQRVRPGSRGGRTVLEPWEAEEARDLLFGVSWNAHMGHRATGRGNVSSPPAGAPAVAQPQPLSAPGRAF
jgi:hypothetical protein